MTGGGMSGAPPTGTVTFLFTDIEGSTPLWDAHPDTMGASLARHDDILRTAINDGGGHIFSTGGDGYGAVFTRAASAVHAAIDAQIALATASWADGPALAVRMGLHTGEAEERDGDYFGPPVNRAARIMGAAHGGQVVVSALTAQLVGDDQAIKLFDLGPIQLKGVIEPVHVVGVAGDGHEWIDRPLATSEIAVGNLPRLQTESVGDLADLQRRVANLADARVVTLTGSGGVGKTRAAIEIGWLVTDEFVDGVWLVELAAIADPEMTIPAIASTLGVRPDPGMTVAETIVDWCFGRRMVLIVDNCEHVLGPVSDLVEAIVARCPTVTIIATSREPLGIAGEQVVRIASLGEAPAVELFLLRAAAADSSFDASSADRQVIGAICTRVDGIPLAIELAAARTRALSPPDLLRRLDDRFKLLRGGGRGGLERHQTLRATVAWSYDLLSDDAKLLFDRVSVFAGGFDADAAEAICAGGDIDEYDVLDLISELVDKSMVTSVHSDAGTRYRLLETLRQFGEERLDARGETITLRDAHLSYYVDLAERLDERFMSPEQAAIGHRFDAEWENLRSAHDWTIVSERLDDAVSIIETVGAFAFVRFRREFAEWAERTHQFALARNDPRSRVYAYVSIFALFDGRFERVIELVTLGVDDPDPDVALGCQTILLTLHQAQGHTEAARAMTPRMFELAAGPPREEVLQVMPYITLLGGGDTDDPHYALALQLLADRARQLRAPWAMSEYHRLAAYHGFLAKGQSGVESALEHCDRAIELGRSIESDLTWVHQARTAILILSGDPDGPPAIRSTLAAAYDQRHWLALAAGLDLAAAALATMQRDAAGVVLGNVELSPPSFGGLIDDARRRVVAAVADLPDLESLRARGAAMDRHEIVAFALAALDEVIAASN
jgi:predicted ATPase/class 3 adenylate cyclase